MNDAFLIYEHKILMMQRMRFLACFEVQPICVKRGNMPQPGGKNGQKIE
jgi:hypothetical protein